MFFMEFQAAFAMSRRPKLGVPSGSSSTAEDFTLPDIDGGKISLSDYRGKVVFLNFFATWCPPCMEEMPSMQTLHDEMRFDNFVMLAVCLDKTGISAVKDFAWDKGYTFKVLHDPDGAVAYRYGVRSIPATFIIGKEGKIESSILGSRDWSRESVIRDLRVLAGK